MSEHGNEITEHGPGDVCEHPAYSQPENRTAAPAEPESVDGAQRDYKDRVIFAYPESKHWFILRPHLDDEQVTPAAISAIRFQLDAWG